ncbi:MAG: O-antigen ligase family protein [Desulfobacula sp.]|nr:O-antigen ligase family protein [Desulfobacula sp.]
MSSDSTILTRPLSQFFYYSVLCTIPFYYWRQVTPFLPVDWYITAILGLIVIIYMVNQKDMPALFSNNLNKWFLFFFFVNIVSTIFSPYQSEAVSGLVILVQVYIFIFINLTFLTEKGLVNILPYVLAASVGFNSIIASLDYFFGVELFYVSESARSYGVTTGANNLSLMSVFVIPLLFNKLLTAKSPLGFFGSLFLILINIAGLISSESRGGFLIFFVMAIMVLYINRTRFQPRFFGLAISIIGLCMLLVATAIPDAYFKRQQSLLSEEQDTSIQRRTAYIKVGIQSFFDHPLLGTGTFTFPQVWLDSRETLFFKMAERGAHNTYLDTLVGMGIIGLMIFLGLLSRIFRDFITAIQNFDLVNDLDMKDMASAYLVSFLTVLAYCLLKTLIDHKFFILSISISQVLYFISKNKKDRLYGPV